MYFFGTSSETTLLNDSAQDVPVLILVRECTSPPNFSIITRPNSMIHTLGISAKSPLPPHVAT